MAAVFGVVGSVSGAELDEMGRRLQHRGEHAVWHQVANSVYIGQVSSAQRSPYLDSRFSLAIDAPDALIPNAYERILNAFRRSQDACDLDRELRIPFALAAWDAQRQELCLCRDFLGLKPLHFCVLPSGGIAFATEYKALLAIDELPATADLEAIRSLQMYKAVPAGKTMLAGVSAVAPGAVMRVSREGLRTYDRMPEVRLAVRPMTEEQAAEKLRVELEKATTPLVEGRDRVGLALSGGIDSMSVAFLARKCAPQAELVGFTAGHSADDPEVCRAAEVMACLGGEHRPLVVSHEELSSKLPLAVWHLENPIGRSETFQYLAIAKAARDQGFDNLLTGMGADLLFGGMPRHRVLWMAEKMPMLRKDLLAFFESTQTGEPSRRPIARLMSALYYRGSVPRAPSVLNCNATLPIDLIASAGPEFINRCLMLDGQEPTSRTLARIERPFQAYGLDYGSPFLDKAVMEFAFTIPAHLKIRRGTQKYILRRAMRPYMSPALRRAPKELMRMTQNGSFAQTLHQLADHYLHRDRVRRRGFFDYEQIAQVLRACRGSYHPETAMRLWTLIVTEIWAEIYLDARGRCPQPGYIGLARQRQWAPLPNAVPST
jgi:asparagine synthase (glutamine-hydrolysing)